jgi:hypothetical protein
MSANRKTYDPFDDEEEYDPLEDPDWCPECQGEGRVPTVVMGALARLRRPTRALALTAKRHLAKRRSNGLRVLFWYTL